MIKIIASDMDHTFLDDNSNLPENIVPFLDHLDSKNIKFVAASGRSMNSLKEKFGELSKRISFVSDNGALVEDQGELIYESVIEPKNWHHMVEVAAKNIESSIILISHDMVFVKPYNAEHTTYLNEFFGGFVETEDLYSVEEPIIKVTFLSLKNSQHNHTNVVGPHFSDNYNVVMGGAIWIDIMNQNINKGNGLKHLLDKYDYHEDHLMAFGDYNNDIEMLQLANYSYAVSNAVDEVKDAAKEIIGSNNEDSVIKKVMSMIP